MVVILLEKKNLQNNKMDKNKFKDLVSKKLNDLKKEDWKFLKKEESWKERERPVVLFLEMLDELIKEEYKKNNIPDNSISRVIYITTETKFIWVDNNSLGSFKYFLSSDSNKEWQFIKMTNETTSSKNFSFDKIEEFFDHIMKEVTNLLAEDIKFYKDHN